MHCFLCVFFTVCFFTFFTSSRAFKPIAEAHWKLQKTTDLRLWKLILFSGCFKQTHRTSRNSTSLHIYIYLNFNTLGIIPRSGFSTLSQYDSYILQNTIWMNTTKIADRCQKWLFGKCIAFQTCYVGWVVQSCTSFRAKQNAEKTWKKREVPCFSGTAPGSAEVIGKPYNISVSQTALRKEPCEFRSSIKDTWRIIPVTLRSK